MSGNVFVDGLKTTDPILYKKIKESLNHGSRTFKNRGGELNYDYVICNICDCIKYGNFNDHLSLHSLDINKYTNMFPGVITTPQRRRDMVFGDKNPAYQHGGKYSPWSDKSTVHTKEQIENSKKKAKDNYTSIRTLQYWINKGFSNEAAVIELGKFQTRDLDFFINNYGVTEGSGKWESKRNKWINTMNSKPDCEKTEINRKKLYKNGSVSRGETSLLNEIKTIVEYPEKITSQLILHIPNSNNFFKYDISFDKKIIEYNGDLWHANPKKYKCSDIPSFPNNKLTAEEIWNRDKRKINIAYDYGYKVLVVWESDYKKNKLNIINQCINFLTT